MNTGTIIINQKGSQYYAAQVGFPVNCYRKTKRGAMNDVERIKRNNPGTVFVVKDLTK